MNPQKELPKSELSLKFIAWDVKQIGENLNKINESLLKITELVALLIHNKATNPKDDQIPF